MNGSLRAQDRDIRMFAFLDTHKGLLSMTHRQLAEQLNALNVLNTVNQLGKPRSWTQKSAGNLRRRYDEEQRVQRDLDDNGGILGLGQG